MPDQALSPHTIINSEHDYALAIDTVIAAADTTLLIFDQDLMRGDYAGLKRYQALHDFLQNKALSQLCIVLQDTRFFNNHCPHLWRLLQTYGHKMVVYETNQHAKIAKDCFVLADAKHYCRRFHIDQARFKFALDDAPTTRALNQRFQELLQETSETLSPTKIGL